MAYTSEIEKLERRWNENPLGLTFAPLAEAYRKAGDHTRALELLELGLAQHPNYVPAHIVRGRCHLDTAGEDAAELAFLRVVELDPENAIALKSLAEICERTGRLPEAVRRLEMLLDVDRTNEEARQQLERVRGLAAGGAITAPSRASAPPAPSAFPAPPESSAAPRSSTSWMRDAEPVAAPQAESPPLEPAAAPVSSDDDLGDIAVFEPESLSTSGASEFQLPSDAESLQPTGDRLADIVLGSEIPEQSLPLHEAATGQDMIAPPDAAVAGTAPLPGAELAAEPIVPEVGSASERPAGEIEPLQDQEATPTAWAGSVFEPTSPEAVTPAAEEPVAAEPEGFLAEHHSFDAASVSEPVVAEPSLLSNAMFPISSEPEATEPEPFEPLETAEPIGVEPDLVPVGASLGDVEPPRASEPAPPLDREVPAAAAAASLAEGPDAESDGDGHAPAAEPELVVTESMAEVFLRQGHRELALAVYTQLAQRDPANALVLEAADRLRAELAPPPPPAPPPAPRYDAAATGGVSVGHRLGGLFGASRPAVAAPVHPPAYEPPRRSGEPTRAAGDSLSLSAVFGEDAAASPVGPVSAPAESSEAEPSFDEFFSPEADSAELPSPPPPAPEAAGAPAQSGEDLERFNTWLRNLKS